MEEEEQPKASLRTIINALGGADNILDLNACLTRLRISVKKPELVDKLRLEQLGAKGVVVVGNGIQVVYGTKAESLRRLLQRYIDTRS